MSTSQRADHTDRAPVRPRAVWGGLLVAVLGLCVVGAGISALSWTWSALGVLALAVGGGLMWRGGVMHDAHATKPVDHELRDVREGGTQEGVSAEQELGSDAARRRAAFVTEQTRALLASRTHAPAPPLRPIGVTALLVLGVWLLIAQYALGYPFTVLGQNSALRDLGPGLVVLLAAFWLRQCGPSRVATALCLLSGVALLVFGFAVAHDAVRVQWNEILSGLLVMIGAALTVA